MYSQQPYPPPYGVDAGHAHPLTTQPQSAWAESHYGGGAGNNRSSAHMRPPTPPPGALPKVYSMDPGVKDNNGGSGNPGNTNIGGINTNTNTNNNSSNSNSSVVVNANVMAGAGLGTGNRLCLVGKDLLMSRHWNSGLFSCMNDVLGCALSLVCFPLDLMRIANRLNECACVSCCVPGGLATLRTKLRTMGGIRGSICSDCVAAHFCSLRVCVDGVTKNDCGDVGGDDDSGDDDDDDDDDDGDDGDDDDGDDDDDDDDGGDNGDGDDDGDGDGDEYLENTSQIRQDQNCLAVSHVFMQ
ncbi:placenta-specific gene 8 protein-like [Elysia marginata]|uniref:Placenta-specific gene 8 protein-like n=1 Tax=Elysia marginata TaxID=1093978 RepID=A0AAV4HHB9_9GAST|nr:placenta-specific gene 8 protein-like [Elysia marginata]